MGKYPTRDIRCDNESNIFVYINIEQFLSLPRGWMRLGVAAFKVNTSAVSVVLFVKRENKKELNGTFYGGIHFISQSNHYLSVFGIPCAQWVYSHAF